MFFSSSDRLILCTPMILRWKTSLFVTTRDMRLLSRLMLGLNSATNSHIWHLSYFQNSYACDRFIFSVKSHASCSPKTSYTPNLSESTRKKLHFDVSHKAEIVAPLPKQKISDASLEVSLWSREGRLCRRRLNYAALAPVLDSEK